MEYQKITNLLGTAPGDVSRFITKKWIEVHDQSSNAEDRYKPSKQTRFKTSMLRSDLCDFIGAYIVVKGTITDTNPDNNAYDKKLAFKNNAPFVSCILKINNTFSDNAEDLDIVKPMYNLIEYSKKLFKNDRRFLEMNQTVVQSEMTYRDEPNSGANNNINYSIKDSKSFDYKTSITGKLEGNNKEKEVENCCAIKTSKQFLDNTRHSIN